jgi:hypothetical protein
MIRYREGFKYQLDADYVVPTPIRPDGFVLTPFLRLDTDGELAILAGFAWDGPSGPAIDTRNFMRGSLIHDALYALLREGHIGPQWRQPADEFLRTICMEDGMTSIRAWWVYLGVRVGGGPAARRGDRPVLVAP